MKKFNEIQWHLEDGYDALKFYTHVQLLPEHLVKYGDVCEDLKEAMRKINEGVTNEADPVEILDEEFPTRNMNRVARRVKKRHCKRRMRELATLTDSVQVKRNGGVMRTGNTFSWYPVWKQMERRLRRHDGKNVCRGNSEDFFFATDDSMPTFDEYCEYRLSDDPDITEIERVYSEWKKFFGTSSDDEEPEDLGGYWDNERQIFVKDFDEWFEGSEHEWDYTCAREWGDKAEAEAVMNFAKKEYCVKFNLDYDTVFPGAGARETRCMGNSDDGNRDAKETVSEDRCMRCSDEGNLALAFIKAHNMENYFRQWAKENGYE